MKVLHLTTHVNLGGITKYILTLIEPLKRHGVETWILSSGGSCSQALRDRGAHLVELPIRTKSELNPKLYCALPQVKKIIRDNGIDVLHAHTRVTQMMTYWIQRSISIPVITTCHGFYKRRLGRRLIPAWGDRVVAISQMVAEHLASDFKVAAGKIRLVNNAVDFDEIDSLRARCRMDDAKKKYGIPPEDPVIGVVARLVEDKGHEYLIRAIAELKISFPGIRLIIVGDGKCRNRLKKIVSELALEKSVIFTGNLENVIEPLCAFDVFALPATWREGFGLSIVEAMACEKPVIVTNIWALNALIQNRVTGILIQPKSVPSLVESIRNLLNNVKLRSDLGTQGRQMAEKLFSMPRMAKEIFDLYEEVCTSTLVSTP